MQYYAEQYHNSEFQPILIRDGNQFQPGDFYLMNFWDRPSHARVIVGSGYSQEGIDLPASFYGVLADQHSTDRYRVIWDDGVPPTTPVWLWHVAW